MGMQAAAGLPDPTADAQFYEGVAVRRGVAFVIDAILIGILAILVTIAFGIATLGVGLALGLPITLTVSFLYRFLSLARWSATPGMRLAGLELRRSDGGRFSEPEAALHTALFLFFFFTVIPQLASVALMIVGRDGRGLHDVPLGSAMINRPG